MRNGKLARFVVGITAGMATLAASAQSLPSQLAGSWKIARVLPTHNTACWDTTQAQPLLGSTLYYSSTAMRWRGGEVPLQGITMRMVTGAQFKKENSGIAARLTLRSLEFTPEACWKWICSTRTPTSQARRPRSQATPY